MCNLLSLWCITPNGILFELITFILSHTLGCLLIVAGRCCSGSAKSVVQLIVRHGILVEHWRCAHIVVPWWLLLLRLLWHNSWQLLLLHLLVAKILIVADTANGLWFRLIFYIFLFVCFVQKKSIERKMNEWVIYNGMITK